MSEQNPKRTCATCLNFYQVGNESHGHCHKYPPQVVSVGANAIDFASVWPEVTIHAWCAQWELEQFPERKK